MPRTGYGEISTRHDVHRNEPEKVHCEIEKKLGESITNRNLFLTHPPFKWANEDYIN
jgi:hypothetical protein